MVNINSYVGYNSDNILSLFIDAEFDENYIEGQSISEITISYDDNIPLNSYPDNDFNVVIPTKDEENEEVVTKFKTVQPLSSIVDTRVPHIFVVYAKVDNTNVEVEDLVNSKCEDQKDYYYSIVYDYSYDVKLALSLASELTDCSCEIPQNYINKYLQISAIKLAIECGDIEKIKYYFKKFFGSTQVQRKHCGCNG